MATNAPGMHFRKGMSLIQLFRMFPDDEATEKWFIHTRWPDGMACLRCGSTNINEKATHPTMSFNVSNTSRLRQTPSWHDLSSDTLGQMALNYSGQGSNAALWVCTTRSAKNICGICL